MEHRDEAAVRALLEGLPDATVCAGTDGVIVFVNTFAESLFGYTREELFGKPISVLWPERVRERYVRNMELYFQLEHPLRFTERAYGLRSDGSEFVGEMSWGIVETEDGPLLVAIGRDITWKGYMQSMGRACRHPEIGAQDDTQHANVGDQYAARHNPFV